MMHPERLLRAGVIVARLPEAEQARLVQWLYARLGNQHAVAARAGLSLRRVRQFLQLQQKTPA